MGWIEILRIENTDENTIVEIEKDVDRLQIIADRFSKIGSEPILENKDIIEETQRSCDYLQSRFSKQVFWAVKPSLESTLRCCQMFGTQLPEPNQADFRVV